MSSTNGFLTKWDSRFLRIAEEVKTWSKDPGTKVGCVLVEDRRIIATGYNGFPAGLSDELTLYKNREFKLRVTVHAEANAILNAARNGSNTRGCTAYVTFPPCSQCASALIQAGIARVVCPNPSFAVERWREDFQTASDVLCGADMTVHYYSEADLCGDQDLRHMRREVDQ